MKLATIESRDFCPMDRAKVRLQRNRPFFAAILMQVRVSADPSVPTACINTEEMRYNPDWFAAHPDGAQETVLAHEAAHLALGHSIRRGDRDPRGWNVASDYAANLLLADDGSDFEGLDPLLDDRFRGMSAERIYRELYGDGNAPDNKPPEDGRGGEAGEQGEGEPGQGQPGESGESGESGQPGEPGEGDAADGKPGDAGAGKGAPSESPAEQSTDDQQSGGSSGEPGDAGEPGGDNPDPGGMGGVEDGTDGPMTPAEVAAEEEKLRVIIEQAAMVARGAGADAGRYREMLGQVLEARADWRNILREFLLQQAKEDFSWSRPNRRYIHQSLYLPGRQSEAMPPFVMAVDTSGSVSAKELAQATAEMNDILGEFSADCRVVYCDSRVQEVDEFRQGEPVELRQDAPGRGGTAFGPVFDWVEEQVLSGEMEKPAALIYFSWDLDSWDRPDEPDYPVVWVSGRTYRDAPFGKHVLID